MNERHASLPAIALAGLLCLGFAPLAPADGTQPAGYPDTGQLGTEWWQLVMSIPGPQNPFLDETGASCGIGQRGSTWFLYSSSLGPRVDLKCTIPAGKTIFLAVVTAICVPFPGETVAQQFEFCRMSAEATDVLNLRIDGEARNELIERRASTRTFALPVPDDNVFGFASGVFVAVHDGFYAKIPPLEPGHHTIRVRGGITSIGYAADTLYHLNIVKPDKALPTFPQAAKEQRAGQARARPAS